MTTNEPNPVYPITIYGKPDSMCFGCKKSKELFNAAGVQFKYFDLTAEENKPLLEALKEQKIMGAPYIETPDDKWTGMDRDKVTATIAAYKAAVEAAA